MGARPIHSVVSLLPRADLFKCEGHGLPACGTCCRALAPDAGAAQHWIDPTLTGGICDSYASVEKFASIYVPPFTGVPALQREGRQPE
jgi:hypothetical protein